jgi:hypothetical protein
MSAPFEPSAILGGREPRAEQGRFTTWDQSRIQIPPGATGQITTLCPECSHTRSAAGQRKPCLSVNVDERVWQCHHCGWSGHLANGKAPRITLADLAADKRLPVAFLRELGLDNLPAGGVGIPYHLLNGQSVYVKSRISLIAKEGSFVPKGVHQMPYGLERLQAAREAGFVVLVEGESDCWTLWHHGCPALGIPGAQATKTLLNAHLVGISVVYAVQEPDQAGAEFVQALAKRIPGLRVVRLDVKDPNDLHKRDPDGFKAAFDAALKAARPLLNVRLVGISTAGPPDVPLPPPCAEHDGFVPIGAAEEGIGKAHLGTAQGANGGGEEGESRPRVMDVHDFMAMELPPRETVLAPWLLTQSLNLIYSWRGVGKTHVSLGIAFAVASGGEFLGWKADRPRKVLFVDGEMPAVALQERIAAIAEASELEPERGFLQVFTSDVQPAGMPDLATLQGQTSLDSVVGDAELVILDNLSALVRGDGHENDAESWLLISGWALKHRAKGRSIVFIHHAGKNGSQRGTSKREDLLDATIKLKHPSDYTPEDGARFEVHFEKARAMFGEEAAPIDARLALDAHGKQAWIVRSVSESTSERVVALSAEGLKQSAIAQELGVNRSTVSRALRKANGGARAKTTLSAVVKPRRDVDG